MGNLKPKLSRAVIREREIRAQLGLGPNGTAKTKGRLGAERAKRELERRERVKRQRYPRWDDLCFELQDMVLSHLSIADLASAREAGLGAVSISSRLHMHRVMRGRCEKLQPLWNIWRRGTPRYASKNARKQCRPVEFASTVKRLCVSPDSGGLPDSIHEMKALRALDISRTDHSAILGVPPPLTKLPKTLSLCQTLLDVQMRHHDFEEIPECVLHLKNLKRLVIDYNPRLKCIPEDIGERLPKLLTFSVWECSKVKTLPKSLLERLEKNTKAFNRKRVPLFVSERYFEDNYLKETITKADYPILSQYRENGLLTPPRMDLVVHDLMMAGVALA